MTWLICLVIGAVLTALTGAFFHGNPMGLSVWGMVCFTIPITIFAQYAFARAFSTAPVFFVAWFLGTACCSVGAFLVSKYIFLESWKLLDALGVIYILIGAALLAIGSKL